MDNMEVLKEYPAEVKKYFLSNTEYLEEIAKELQAKDKIHPECIPSAIHIATDNEIIATQTKDAIWVSDNIPDDCIAFEMQFELEIGGASLIRIAFLTIHNHIIIERLEAISLLDDKLRNIVLQMQQS